MDVRCERCKTEYEFDDARITEAGVAVKCTTCGHVFKVKKKALVVTVPVKPDDVAAQNAIPAIPSPPVPASAQDKREWKVRQANGNVFTFKELTTLQKWIVERKVARDDEISLTGETWKRLGNIAELASFFQVVEEAQKATHLAALQAQGLLTPIQPPVQPIDAEQGGALGAGATPTAPAAPPVTAAPPTSVAAPASTATSGASAILGTDAGSASFDAAVRATAASMAAADARAQSGDAASSGAPGAPGPNDAPPAQAQLRSGVRGGAVASAPPSTPRSPPTLTPPQVSASAASARTSPPRPESGEPRFVTTGQAVRSAAREAPDDDLAAAGLKRSGGVGKAVLYLLVLAAIGAGGYYGYLHYWLPSQSSAAGATASGAPGTEAAAPASSEADAQVASDTGAAPADIVQAQAAEDAGQATEDAGTLAEAPLDAGTSADVVAASAAETVGASATEAVVPAKTAAANVDEKPTAGRGYDYWLAQGDRLRVRERFAAALQAYGKAADLEPRRAEPLAGRGLVLLDQGREPQAEAAFREALELNPRYAVALMGLAETYKVMGKKAEAVQYYRKYLEILPNGPEAGVARAAIDRLKE